MVAYTRRALGMLNVHGHLPICTRTHECAWALTNLFTHARSCAGLGRMSHSSSEEDCSHRREPVAAWDVEAVCAWAQENRIPEFAVLARSQDIDGPVLLTMQHSDFQTEPLAAALKEAGVSKFGQMRRLELALGKIRQRQEGSDRASARSHAPGAGCDTPSSSTTEQHAGRGPSAPPLHLSGSSRLFAHHQGPPTSLPPASAASHRRTSLSRESSADMDPRVHDANRGGGDTPPHFSKARETMYRLPRSMSDPRMREVPREMYRMPRSLSSRSVVALLGDFPTRRIVEPMPSALFRLAFSILWCAAVTFASAGVMTFVHDRVPDMDKYPPLPDVVLDHIPVIPWAFEASEVCILFLAFVFIATIAFHRYRLQVNHILTANNHILTANNLILTANNLILTANPDNTQLFIIFIITIIVINYSHDSPPSPSSPGKPHSYCQQ